MYQEFKEPLYAPPPMLSRMVDAGLLGRNGGEQARVKVVAGGRGRDLRGEGDAEVRVHARVSHAVWSR